MEDQEFKYWGFISYSHRDQRWGAWLHRKLETYRVPTELREKHASTKQLPDRLFPVFRDREELPTASYLGSSINDALEQSRVLIVICSRASAQSRWVNEEILTFKRMGRANRIFCVIVDGEPNVSDDPSRISEECFAESLRYKLAADGTLTEVREEPIAADARPGKDGRNDALLKVTAGVLGVGFDELKKRDLQRQLWQWIRISIAATLVLALTVGLAIYAWLERSEALRQEQLAEANFRKARAAVDQFFIEVSDRELFEAHGLQPLQEKLLRNGLKYYESFLEDRSDDRTLLLDTALTHERMGQISELIGDRSKAVQSFEICQATLDRLLAQDPNSFELRLKRAGLRDNLSTTHWTMGNSELALKELKQAQAELSKLIQEQPANEEARLAWRIVSRNLGPFQRKSGLIEEALATYLAAWTDQASTDVQGEPTANLYSAAAAMNLGVLFLEEKHDIGKAIEWFEKAGGMTEQLLTQRNQELNSTETRTLRELMSSTYTYLGVAYHDDGDHTKSITATETGLKYASALAEQNPAVTDYQEQVANLSSNLAAFYEQSRNLVTAYEMHTSALQCLRRLTSNHPKNLQYQFKLAQAQNNFAIHLVNGKKPDDAAVQYTQSLELMKQIRASIEESPRLVLQIVNSHRNLGSVYVTLEQFSKAKHCYELARDDLAHLANTSEGLQLAGYLEILQSIHERLIAIEESLDSAELAVVNREAALRRNVQEIALLETLLKENEDDSSLRRRLANSFCRYGQLLLSAEQMERATEVFLQVQQMYDTTGTPESVNEQDRPLIAYAVGNLGWISLLRREFDESIQFSQTADKYHPAQRWIHMNLATAFLCSNKYSEAKELYLQLKDASSNEAEFKDSLLDEFGTLREAKIDSPNMEKIIEDLFTANPD